MRPSLNRLVFAFTALLLIGITPRADAVVDEAPPQIFCPADLVVTAPAGMCAFPVEPVITATDDIEVFEIVTEPPPGSLFPVGTTIVRSTAYDYAGNSASCEFKVHVVSGSVVVDSCAPNLKVQAPFGSASFAVTLTPPVVRDTCSTPVISSSPASGSLFPIGTTEVIWSASFPWGSQEICRSQVEITAPDNIVWPRALRLTLTDSLGVLTGNAEQALVEAGEARWYKFSVQPGSRVVVTLTSLPANYDLVLFRDIAAAYRELTEPSDLPLLDAEFADDAFAPAQFSPAQFSPAQFSPAAFSPAQFSPAQFSPAQFSPAQFSPAQFSPAQFSPDAFAPAQFSPAQFSPAQFSPAQFSPAQFSPAQFSPAQFSEAAYAGAQLRSVIAISAFEGKSPEGVVANTWLEAGDFYIRVQGRGGVFDPSGLFRVDAFLFPGVCRDVTPVPVDSSGSPLPPSTTAAAPLGSKTLVLVDYDRLVGPGLSQARSELAAKLAEFASRAEVKGQVLDVGGDPWVRFFNQQADSEFDCPYAKNLLADAIRAIIERSRAGNALEYLVLIGSDHVIPFYRHPDEAMLGPEEDFIPPVFEFSSSQASLRKNFFLSQDRYAARCEVTRKGSKLPLPDLAIGRLVETSSEIIGMIDAYLKTPAGLLPNPNSVLVSGYDFLADAATAVATEWHAGAGFPPETLISPRDLAPSDPGSWSADDLRALLLPKRNDVLFLAGHFNAAGALAADFTTRLLATELLDSSTDYENAFLYSPGCHSGYNIVDSHALPVITLNPDWAQVCARKRMTLLAGTGYQYGDTDFIEYSERLYLQFTRNLRSGSGPVSLGSALTRAKAHYLASTADLRGIHEKALLQATLFGLPMLSYNLPGARLPISSGSSVVPATQGYTSIPPSAGQVLGLQFADLTVNASFVRDEMTLKNVEREASDPDSPAEVTAVWYTGSDGLVIQPAEPVLPLEIRNVTVPGLPLRGIGYRGGEYDDVENTIPLTGAATTEIRGVHPAFVSEEFYPQRFWRANYFGELCTSGTEGTRLFVTPLQVRSLPGRDTATLRRHPVSNFRLFYSANVATYVDPGTGASSTPALSGPPTISKVQATADAGQVTFRVQVIGNPAAGVQEVWILYTATRGALFGRWLPLDLTQSPADSRLWEATLPLGTTDPADLRFQIHAVNGVGLVGLANNLGQYYTPLRADAPPAASEPTTVQLLTPPTEGAYGSRISVRAQLRSPSGPVPGKTLLFKLGGLERRAETDAGGVATASFNLLLPAGSYDLLAGYTGSPELERSATRSTFRVNRAETRLTLSPGLRIATPESADTLVAELVDAQGTAILDQLVIFVVTGDAGSVVRTAATDYTGLARLGNVGLPPGNYTVSAFFGQTVTPPPPLDSLGNPSPRYTSSTASALLTLDASAPTARPDRIEGTAGVPLKIAISELVANDSDPDGSELELVGHDSATGRGQPITRSGGFLLLPTLSTRAASDAFHYTVADGSGKTASARVVVAIVPNESPSANMLEPRRADGFLILRFAGLPGRTYLIQATSNLSEPTWSRLGETTVGDDGLGSFTVPEPDGPTFFRTVFR